MKKPQVLITAWLPEGELARLAEQFPQVEILDAQEPGTFDRHFRQAVITYGLPPVARLGEAPGLRWIQLTSAGVPQDLCPVARERQLVATNLAELYGSRIWEQPLALMFWLP